jgi:hypothetical protein
MLLEEDALQRNISRNGKAVRSAEEGSAKGGDTWEQDTEGGEYWKTRCLTEMYNKGRINEEKGRYLNRKRVGLQREKDGIKERTRR